MKTILFPTDFSDNAKHASMYASMLTNILNAKIYFLNVYTAPIVPEIEFTYELESIIMNNKKEAELKMKNFVDTFAKNTNLPSNRISYGVEFGETTHKIVEVASSTNADMIVMGTKGATNAFDKWLGTVAQKVMHKAQCPVWIIPPTAVIKYPIEVMYAADFKEDEVSATHKIVDITRALGATCRVIHVHDYYEINPAHTVEATQKYLQDEFKGEDVIVRHITRKNITEGLDKYIETHKPDVLAVAVKEKSFFTKIFDTSLTNHFVFGAKLPIITFKK
jgi:nucleotide-binding universal stress UspA family protein